MTAKAGAIVSGFTKVEDALKRQDAQALIKAGQDRTGRAIGRREGLLDRPVGGVRLDHDITVLTRVLRCGLLHHTPTTTWLSIGWKQAYRCAGDSASTRRGFSV